MLEAGHLTITSFFVMYTHNEADKYRDRQITFILSRNILTLK